MSQRDGLSRETITGIAKESSPGTHPGSGVKRIAPVAGGVLGSGFARTPLVVDDEAPVRWENRKHAIGAKTAKWGPLSVLLKRVPSASRLTSTGSTAALSHDDWYEHLYGRRYAHVGTTVSGSSSTTTTIDVASASGRKVGELLLRVNTGEIRRITDVTGSTITVSPAMATSPANGEVIRAFRTFVMAETRTGHLSIEQETVAAGAAAEQYRVVGAMGEGKLVFPKFGEIPTSTLQGDAVDFSGPGTLADPSWSLGHDPADDDMGDALPWQPQVYLDGTLYRTEVDGFSIEIAQKLDPIPDGSRPSGIGSFIDVAGRDTGIEVQGKMRVRLDTDRVADFEAATVRHLMVVCDPTAGVATGGAAVWEMPRVQFIGRPVPVVLGGGRPGYELTYKALRSTDAPSSSSAEDRDLAWSPIRFGLT